MEEKAPLVKRGGWQEATPAIEDEVAKTGRTYCCLCVPVNVGLKLIGVAFILQGVRGFLYVYNGVHSATGKHKAEFDRIVAAMGGIDFLWLQAFTDNTIALAFMVWFCDDSYWNRCMLCWTFGFIGAVSLFGLISGLCRGLPDEAAEGGIEAENTRDRLVQRT
jgi:hypothetical protein